MSKYPNTSSWVGEDAYAWTPSPAPTIAQFGKPAEVEPVTAVWVLLDRLVRPDSDPARSIPDGLNYTGRARGLLQTRSWFRSYRGTWLAYVNYEVYYADGRPQPRLFLEQVVPDYALRKRHDNRPLGGRT